MSTDVQQADAGLSWQLLYTKAHAEAWVEANLRRQGFAVLLPRTPRGAALVPLFPRYVFAGHAPHQRAGAFRGTYGVSRVVLCGDRPARVTADVIDAIRARMDAHGVVAAERLDAGGTLFDARARERTRTLTALAAAGFRVRAA